jgi:hypothetical protein
MIQARAKGESIMRTILLALSGAAVAFTTTAAAAGPPVTGETCTKYKDGVCVETHKVRGNPGYKVGYVFGPTYNYTPVASLPPPVVTQYSLGPDYRYVYNNGYIYVVDPSTYAVTRVIAVPPQ